MVHINGRARKDYYSLDDEFADIYTDVLHSLKSHASDSLSKFTAFLAGNCCNSMVGLPSEQSLKEKPKDWDEMFEKLTVIRAWDCLNYMLLKKIMQRYLFGASDYTQLHAKLESYDSKVTTFLNDTLLLDFLDIYAEAFPSDPEISNGCKLLKTKFCGQLDTMTLADFHLRRGYMLRELKLHHYILSLKTVNPGCVIIYWDIKEEYVEYVKRICRESQPDFGQAGIVELTIEDCVLYQVSLGFNTLCVLI